jgi:ATPase subunit of ABC transporter with duplicated ATPase domains
MSIIRATNVGFAYSGSTSIFENLSFHLEPGWTALVGPNGAGKSTLLDLVRGARKPTVGEIVLPPLACGWCPQRVGPLQQSIEDFANAWTSEAMKWMSRLELDWSDLQRWSTLSPGERKRWQIGSALYQIPELLILDEPTNHLDAEGRQALAAALSEFRGIGLVVSHDRGFIDQLCERVLWLEDGDLRAYRGSWSDVRAAREHEREAALERLEQAQSRVRKLERLQATRRERAACADRGISSRTRMSSVRDSDGRSMSAKFRAQNAAASAAASVGALSGRLDQEKAAAKDAAIGRAFGAEVRVDGFASRKVLGSWAIDEVRAGDRVLLRGVALNVEAGDRVAVKGPNGSGKSTLLRAIHQRVASSVEVLFVPQEWSEEEASRIRSDLLGRSGDELGLILAFVATLGVDPDHLLRSTEWSPGELRKACLAEAFALGEVELMLLDEPTNHLDIPSQERLGAAFEEWPGALVFVSHDEWFVKDVATTRMRIEHGRLEVESVATTVA